jgi:alpha-N-arabinofuranosidase
MIASTLQTAILLCRPTPNVLRKKIQPARLRTLSEHTLIRIVENGFETLVNLVMNLKHIAPLFVIIPSLLAAEVAPPTVIVLPPSLAPAAVGNTNLLPNPSFEEVAAGRVPGWNFRSWQGQGNCRWDLAAPGHTGSQCASIRSEKGSDAAWTATVPVRTNTVYRLSGWIKTRDLRGAVGALLNIQNLQQVRTRAVTGTRDWTQVSTIFWTGEAATLEINCLFGGWGSSTGQAWYDDLALEPVASPAEGAPGAILTIDTDAPSRPYSPMLFGGFIEHFHDQIYGGLFEPGSPLADAQGFRKDVIAAMKELKLSIVRWPGGCFASGYHWTNGVGTNRKPVADPVWGVEDPNTFGTDEFVAWCRLVGCEPYICSNAGNGTPEEMRDWVAYCNSPGVRTPAGERREPLNVRYWSIGNENWGGHEIGARTPREWGPLVRRSAELMRAASPGLKLLAAATADRGWTLPLLKAAGPLLDCVAIHEYWLPCWADNIMPDYLACIQSSEGPERTITRVIELLDEAGFRGRIKIAFDEWNLRGWHHPGFPRKAPVDSRDTEAAKLVRNREKNAIPSQYTMADALFSASFLNACLRHAEDIAMANIAPIVNTRGPLYVHPKGLVKRTTFHVLAMYANELGTRAGRMDLDSGLMLFGGRTLPLVDAAVTVDEPRTCWSIALVNRHPTQAAACVVKLKEAPVEGRFPAVLLAGDSPEAYNDIGHPDRVKAGRTHLDFARGMVQLPPHSLAIVKIPAR